MVGPQALRRHYKKQNSIALYDSHESHNGRYGGYKGIMAKRQ